MRLKIDGELCSGHGRCWKYAPEVFPLDDEGYNAMRGSEVDVSPEHEAAATMGMKACPERAITRING